MNQIKEEECTICLEVINGQSVLGIVENCRHYYHQQCIIQWSSQSNSCPTCRELFYKINVHDHTGLVRSIQVRDKLLPNDAINDIPTEFIIPANRPVSGTSSRFNEVDSTAESQRFGICSICSSSDYRTSLTRNLFTCQACESKFHQNCLGISSLNEIDDEDSTWCCPICDCQQEYVLTPAMIRRRQLQVGSRPRANRPAPNRISRPRARATGLASHLSDLVHSQLMVPSPEPGDSPHPSGRLANTGIGRSGANRNRNTSGRLVIHNENGELDDAFLYESDHDNSSPENSPMAQDPYSPPPIINGGVILRKELKQLESLSAEEAKSWELFDKVKLGTSGSNDSNNSNDETATRRRRKKRTVPQEGSSASLERNPNLNLTNLANLTNTTPTRISSLMSQIRKPTIGPSRSDTIVESGSNYSVSPAGGSPSSSTSNFSPVTSAEGDDSTKIPPLNIDQSQKLSFELTFDQKSQIQKYIRDTLRPLYKRNKEKSKRNDTAIIKNEEDYININKSASRKIYSRIVSMVNESESDVFSQYFQQSNDNLKQLVDNYIKQEISQYSNDQ